MNSLITVYLQLLNLKDAIFQEIIHADATVAVVYKVTPKNSTMPFILKICTRPKDYLNELYFLNYFTGTLPVPRIIKTLEPQEGIAGAILMEYVPGNLITPQDFTDELCYEIGQTLAIIHQSRTARYGDLTKPEALSDDPRTYFIEKFEEGLIECTNNLPEDLVTQCRTYFYENIDLLLDADGPCIVHRDFRPGNLLINNGKLQGIIDWSAARASFAQEDFCSLEHTNWPANPAHKQAFLDGYASIRPVPDYHGMMPLLRLSKAIGVIGFTVKRGTWYSRDAHFYTFNRKFLETLLLKK